MSTACNFFENEVLHDCFSRVLAAFSEYLFFRKAQNNSFYAVKVNMHYDLLITTFLPTTIDTKS